MEHSRSAQHVDGRRLTLGYVPALDGVRAIAVLLVIVGHLVPGTLVGGGIGVDVFFAMSGFLITTLIAEEDGEFDSFGFAKFYVRRALRLMPALIATVVACGVYVAVRWNHLDEFVRRADPNAGDASMSFLRFLGGALTYTTNLFGLEQQSGNFLGHTWSLAVEEQYYLVWPVVLVFALRRRLDGVLAIGLLSCVAALAAVRFGVSAPNRALFYRPEAILLGSAAALARLRSRGLRIALIRWGGLAGTLSLLALLAVAVGVGRVFDKATVGGTMATPIALASAVLVMSVSSGGGRLGSLLSCRHGVTIGRVSYGAYLWHFPIIKVIGWELPGQSSVRLTAVRVLATIAAVWASYLLVEQPFLRRQARYRRVRSGATA